MSLTDMQFLIAGHESLTPAQMADACQLTFASRIDGMALTNAAGPYGKEHHA